MPEDFWPEITPGRVRTPVTVLREQAGLLGRKTMNVVVGDVRGGPAEKGFRYRLDLVAPALGNYRFTAVTMTHGIELYPVAIWNHLVHEAEMAPAYPDDKEKQALAEILHPPRAPVLADSEDELKDALREILSSAEMKRVIETLIAQSEAISTEAR